MSDNRCYHRNNCKDSVLQPLPTYYRNCACAVAGKTCHCSQMISNLFITFSSDYTGDFKAMFETSAWLDV